MGKPWYLDRDTDAADLDGPEPEYESGTSYEERMAALGVDTSKPLGTWAAQLRQLGHDVPELPPLTDR